jgi:glycosyltransferase involved in cell wall biosynthesis
LKIAFLTHEYPPIIFGGIGGSVKNLAAGLSRLGEKVTILSGFPVSHSGKGVIREVDSGVTVFRFPYPNVPPHHVVFQLANLKKMQHVIEEEAPDVIHGQSGSSFPALLSLKGYAPFIVTFHASPLMEKITSTQSILRGGSLTDLRTYVIGYLSESFVYKKEFQRSDLSIAVSDTLKSELLTEMGQEYHDKTCFVYNGVNLEKLDKEYEEVENRVDEEENVILFAGRLYWRKGALNIVKMAYLLQKQGSKCRILVHGTGPLFKKMQSEIRFFGLRNIELKGFTSREQLMTSMRLCKFVAVPSMYEACPMTLLDGMCLGKIPLMFNLPFASELTESGKYGVLADGVKSLTHKIIELEKEGDLDDFSTHIREFARRKYDVNETARRYLEIYQELCQ